MKPILLFSTCFLIAGLISCNPDKNDNHQVQQDFNLTIPPELRIENPKLISVIKEYIESSTDSPSRVYTLLVHRENKLTTSFQLSCIVTTSELNDSTPLGYFTIDDDVVLVYSGLEHLCKADEIFIKQLHDIIGDRIVNDLLPDGKTRNPEYRPMVFDPSTWEVKIVHDSITVQRGVMNLLGPPVVEVIKFLPPKVK